MNAIARVDDCNAGARDRGPVGPRGPRPVAGTRPRPLAAASSLAVVAGARPGSSRIAGTGMKIPWRRRRGRWGGQTIEATMASMRLPPDPSASPVSSAPSAGTPSFRAFREWEMRSSGTDDAGACWRRICARRERRLRTDERKRPSRRELDVFCFQKRGHSRQTGGPGSMHGCARRRGPTAKTNSAE